MCRLTFPHCARRSALKGAEVWSAFCAHRCGSAEPPRCQLPPVFSAHSPPPLNRVWALHSFLLLLNAAHTGQPPSPSPSLSSFFFFFSTHPPISHSISSIQGDASPSHPAPFNSVHCVHLIPAPIPRIFRILGETLRILRTQRARSFSKPKPRGHPGVGRVLPGAVVTPIRGEVWGLIRIKAYESR